MESSTKVNEMNQFVSVLSVQVLLHISTGNESRTVHQ